MIKVGITGQKGFVGTHLYNQLRLLPDIECISFEDSFFESSVKLREFVKACDAIVHLAAMNRHPDPKEIFRVNLQLVSQLIEAMEIEGVKPHVLFSSSTQEEQENEYGKSKRMGRELLQAWAQRTGASFTGMVIPNVYGPFGLPNYNSFIATFCHNLTNGKPATINVDSEVRLIYIGNLCKHIIQKIVDVFKSKAQTIEEDRIPCDFSRKVSSILQQLEMFKDTYLDQGYIPELMTNNDINLFNTFRSYIDPTSHFPVKLIQHTDERGTFVETMKTNTGGQISFSTTLPGITRGNHYHSRKIERFTVIKGKARIQLRKIGTNDILNFDLDGSNPAYVDMPVWYTHNITNIGDEELYTQFWINEWYNPNDPDTYFESV